MSNTREGAPCVDANPELFFNLKNGADVKRAKNLCAKCTHQVACLNEAIEYKKLSGCDLEGIYGGFTPEERNQLTRKKAS